ncbi:MAG: hypothetical protein QOF78_2107 [Phycisphaerales bacterium]|nr:hypothetical protein [Phycisphaerales bacterium]
MAVARRPETIIALRARHEAFCIASAVFRGAGVNVEQLNCHTCGGELDWKHATEQVAIDCPSCGAVNELPCHLRFRVPPSELETETLDYASAQPDRRQWWNDVVPLAQSVQAAMPIKRPPVWLSIFCLTCLMIVLTALVFMAIYALN